MDMFKKAVRGMKKHQLDKLNKVDEPVKLPKPMIFSADQFIEIELHDMQYCPAKEQKQYLLRLLDDLRKQYNLKRVRPNWLIEKEKVKRK